MQFVEHPEGAKGYFPKTWALYPDFVSTWSPNACCSCYLLLLPIGTRSPVEPSPVLNM